MIRKLLLLAITTGLAAKLYRSQRGKQVPVQPTGTEA
jgi:hypothetical protein